MCIGKRVCKQEECPRNFEKTFASTVFANKWSELNTLKPWEVTISANHTIYIVCDKCNHTYKNKASDITRARKNGSSGCSYCSNTYLCEKNDCKICYNKSFASHEKANRWSDKNTKKARDVFRNSPLMYIFNCKCGHEYKTSPNGILTRHKCIYCSHTKLCDNVNCEPCHKNSFASHEKAKYWSKNNKDITPRSVFKSTGVKYLFVCGKCNHEFSIGLNKICSGKWCSYCSHHRLCENKDCKACFDKSFASNPLHIYLVDKTLNPRMIFKSSTSIKYEFKCAKGHIFSSLLGNVAKKKWCPNCMNKTEGELLKFLEDKGYDVKTQMTFSDCINPKTKQKLRYDFFIEEEKTLIELDGMQHFKNICNWGDYMETQKRDIMKINYALKNGYSIIHLLQDDVFNNKNNWQKKLIEAISGDVVECIFIDNGNMYAEHKRKLNKK